MAEEEKLQVKKMRVPSISASAKRRYDSMWISPGDLAGLVRVLVQMSERAFDCSS